MPPILLHLSVILAIPRSKLDLERERLENQAERERIETRALAIKTDRERLETKALASKIERKS